MPIEPIADKWRAFGWNVIDIDGHDMDQILKAYATARSNAESGGKKPTFILARTVKGKGVSFMENNNGWHGVAPTKADGDKARAELRGKK
jgi:transketolase